MIWRSALHLPTVVTLLSYFVLSPFHSLSQFLSLSAHSDRLISFVALLVLHCSASILYFLLSPVGAAWFPVCVISFLHRLLLLQILPHPLYLHQHLHPHLLLLAHHHHRSHHQLLHRHHPLPLLHLRLCCLLLFHFLRSLLSVVHRYEQTEEVNLAFHPSFPCIHLSWGFVCRSIPVCLPA